MITELITTKIFVVDSISAGIPPAVQDRILYDKSDKKLKIYNGSAWQQLENDAVTYAANFETLSANAGAFNGQIGIDAAEEALYFWNGSEWIAAGGSGSITVVADSAAVSALEGELGDVAISSDNNVLWYYSGSAWVSTQELIDIPFVYVAAGNIAANTTSLTGKTNQQMWEALLTKEMNPTVNQPSCGLTMTGATDGSYQEIGATLSLTFKATYEDGSVVNTWGSKSTQSSSYAGSLKSITYTCPASGALVSATTAPNEQTISYKVVAGNQEWKATASYNAGDYQPVTNYGNAYGSKCAAGSKNSSVMNFTGVYPVFANAADNATIAKQTLVGNNSTLTYTMAGESTQNWIIEVPASWNAASGFQTSVVGANSYSYMNGGKTESVAAWASTSITKTINGAEVSYKRYTCKTNGLGGFDLKVTF